MKNQFFMRRPWGSMVTLIHIKKFWFKIIKVTGRTSLQSHKLRTEYHISFWKIRKIEVGEKHRMTKGLYVELAFGAPREEDIIRYEDDYGRVGKTVVVSGGFDPIHVGHLRMFQEAKALGDRLVVVTNNDKWLIRKKGKYFMSAEDRAELIKSIECVDDVFICEDDRDDVCDALEKIKPSIFANGGDRRNLNDIPEAEVCQRLGIEMVFNVGGGKVRSSSELLDNYSSATV